MIVVNAKMTTNEENFKIIKKAVEKLEIETRKEKLQEEFKRVKEIGAVERYI